jgi:heat shock protein HslJ
MVSRVRRKGSLISLGVIFTALSLPTAALDGTHAHGARPTDLEGREWLISNYFVDKEQTWPLRRIGQKRDAYVSFENGVLGGSPGCGMFAGTYHRSASKLTISAKRTDEMKQPCGSDLRKDAEQILRTLNDVRGIQVAPPEWHSDDLLLTDAKGSTLVTLGPMQPGKDLSEFQNTFWRLGKLDGSHAGLSGVIIEIEKGAVTFSTVSYSTGVLFDYKLSGLEFPLASPLVQSSNNRQSWRDQHIAKLFADAFRGTNSYRLTEGSLIFLGKGQRDLIVLSPLQQEGIENRRWHIAKYRGDDSQRGDEEDLVDAVEPAEITFLHGRVEGSPGCGAWAGSYKVSGSHLTVQAGWVLAGACRPAGFQQDRLVEAAFKGELQIEKKGDDILLRDMTGKARILLLPY